VDALIPAFIAVLLAETGDRTQYQTHRLGLTFADHRPVYAALLLVVILNLGIGAVGGALIAGLMTFEARTLFAGLTLALAGLPMLFRLRPAKPITPKRPFITSLVWLFPAQIAGASPFLVAGLSARSATPVLAFVGGLLAILVAVTPPLLLRGAWPGAFPLALLRRIAAILLTGAGLWLALGALRLI
jgi:putative Ca2+/H+ antiporter (TMEM165/GDT1 family)